MTDTETIQIKELNVDMIAPSTATYKNAEQGGSKIVVVGKPGCFSKGTKILMYDGTFRAVEDVQLGDLVMGDDSTPRTVLDLCSDIEEMYDVIPSKGDRYRVNKNHILSLKSTGYNDIKKGTILDITVSDFLKKSKTYQKRFKGYRAPVEFPEKEISLDPYILGYWLGDGHTDGPCITTADPEIVEYFRTYWSTKNAVVKKVGATDITYAVAGITDKQRIISPFTIELKKYGLRGHKHIPIEYKTNSRDVRLKVLAGLLDADGSYDNKGYDLVLKSEELLDDAIYLARSLGFSAYKKVVQKSCTNSPNKNHVDTYYRTFISGDCQCIPCIIPRKMAEKRNQIKDVLVTGITLEPVGKERYYGFELDGNHRFLLSDFTVSHNTGKTSLIASLLYSKKHIFPVAMAMSGTEDSNHFYRSILPSTFVFNSYDEAQVEKFVKRQKIARDHLENPWAMLILDDCTDDPALFRKPLQQGLYKRGRHWKMLYILSLQYGMDVRPVIRTNVDGVFILREPNLRNRKVMYENYGGVIPDFKLFCDILDQITNDYTALYIHNATRSNDWHDCVFWYKAPKDLPKDFKFGCPDYWNFHYARYNPDYVEPVVV